MTSNEPATQTNARSNPIIGIECLHRPGTHDKVTAILLDGTRIDWHDQAIKNELGPFLQSAMESISSGGTIGGTATTLVCDIETRSAAYEPGSIPRSATDPNAHTMDANGIGTICERPGCAPTGGDQARDPHPSISRGKFQKKEKP